MRWFFLLILTGAVGIIPIYHPAAAQNIDPAAKIPLFSQLAQKAADQGHIRVIIQLDVPEIETHKAASAQFKAGRSNAATIVQAASADAALAARIAATSNDVFNRVGTQGIQIRRRYTTFPLLALDLSSQALTTLAQDPQVLHIMEDHLVRPLLDNTVGIVGASASWAGGYTGNGWYVSILDTGIRPTHDMFTGKTIVEACYSALSHCPNNGTSMTGSGAAAHHDDVFRYGWDHGTHVAGIAAGNNGVDLYGVAKDADIIAVQVFSRFDTAGECGVGYTPCVLAYNSDILAGLQYVYSLRATYNIAAVNLSLGGGYYTSNCDIAYTSMKTAIDLLNAAGIATVIASGNSGYCDGIGAPGCISTAVTVGASTDADVMTSFSNYEADLVDLFAPGASIYSSVGNGDSDYESWNGTSMATPHVTGAFALLRQADNASSVAALLTSLSSTGDPVDDSANCGDSGTLTVARIQVDDAIDFISTVPNAPDGLVATAAGGNTINLAWNDNADNEQGFKIERKTGAGGSYSQIGTVGASVTSYTDNASLTELTAFYYRIRAYNGAGNSTYSAEANETTLLMAPSGFSGSGASQTQINLAWTDNSDAESGFEIYRRTGSDAFAQITTTGANVESYDDTGLSAGTTYDYRIRSTDGSNFSAYVQTNVATAAGGGGSSGGGCFLSIIFQ